MPDFGTENRPLLPHLNTTNHLHNNNELIIDFSEFCRYTMLVSLQKKKQETVYELQMI